MWVVAVYLIPPGLPLSYPYPTLCSVLSKLLDHCLSITRYKGIYHAMNQGGFVDPDPDPKFRGVVNWTHAVR